MIEKVRPIARAEYDFGNDGRDGKYYVQYLCPKCHRKIGSYKAETACDECGTFYDWSKQAHIKTYHIAEWDKEADNDKTN